jgi:hypothetical protein
MYNCPNTENIRSIKFISGEANFINPIFFRIRTIVHCVNDNITFCIIYEFGLLAPKDF